MKRTFKLTFFQQFTLCVSMGLVCILCAHLFQTGLFHNVYWTSCGVLFLVNPVWPEFLFSPYPEKQRLGARIAAVIMICLGLLGRFGI